MRPAAGGSAVPPLSPVDVVDRLEGWNGRRRRPVLLVERHRSIDGGVGIDFRGGSRKVRTVTVVGDESAPRHEQNALSASVHSSRFFFGRFRPVVQDVI